MPADPKAQELVQLLDELTRDEALEWSATPDEDTFRAPLANGSVRLAPTGELAPDLTPPDTISVTVSDAHGRVLETFTPAVETTEHKHLASLYANVRRSVLGIEEALESILAELRARKKARQRSGS